MNTLKDNVLIQIFRSLSTTNCDEKPSDLTQVALVSKRFYQLALETLKVCGKTRSFSCFYDILEKKETRLQAIRISYLHTLKLDLSKFKSGYLDVLLEAQFAPTLVELEISSNQIAELTEEDVAKINQLPSLKRVALRWFYETSALKQLAALDVTVIEPT